MVKWGYVLELGYCEPACANADSLVMLASWGILFDELECENECEVNQEKEDNAERWEFEKVGMTGR